MEFLNGLTNDEYRALPRISNSDLSYFERSLFAKDQVKFSKSALEFGTGIHEQILEPHLQNELHESVNKELFDRVLQSSLKNEYLSWLINHEQTKKEQVVLWEHEGLLLKSKLDIVFNLDVLDLKTTACSSEKAFRESCTEYKYHRQGAFYLDSIGAKTFTFIAISKTRKKDNVFVYEAPKQMIERGRKEYTALLREWKRQNRKYPNT